MPLVIWLLTRNSTLWDRLAARGEQERDRFEAAQEKILDRLERQNRELNERVDDLAAKVDDCEEDRTVLRRRQDMLERHLVRLNITLPELPALKEPGTSKKESA
jgi:uncharacterized protein YlxW (UPF0749 family)